MTDDWRDIPGYEGLYQAHPDGLIRSVTVTTTRTMRVWGRARTVSQVRHGRILKPNVLKIGYKGLSLCKNGKEFRTFVHHLIALTFIGPRPSGMHVCHQDGNPLNNKASNLRYDTPAGNAGDREKHGTGAKGVKNPMAILDDAKVRAMRLDIVAGILNMRQIAAKYGCSRQAVNDVKQKRRWAHVV